MPQRVLRRRVLEVHGGVGAHVQLYSLYLAGGILRLVGFRGVQRIGRVLGRRGFNTENSVVLDMGSGAKLRVYLNDGYWAPLLFAGFDYEPEIRTLLERVSRDPDLPNVGFIDCGANIGYWSAMAATTLSTRGTVLAIEACPPRFERLLENAGLNGESFSCLPAAIWVREQEAIRIVSHDERSGAGSLMQFDALRQEDGYRTDWVPSVTLDSVSDSATMAGGPGDADALIIKLDVEGAEVPALEGAQEVLRRAQPLIIFEDHGSDPMCRVSKHILQELQLNIYYDSGGTGYVQARSIGDIEAVKTNPSRGYNFFACSATSHFSKFFTT